MSETFAKVTENLTETPKYTEYTENSEIIINTRVNTEPSDPKLRSESL